jgi:DNA-binding MarR family transcriptional regulator
VIKHKILAHLVELAHWEWANLPLLKTVVGRHVYFCIVYDTYFRSNDPTDRSLKQVLNHPEYTDRAVRMKLREMEEEGLITRVYNEKDKRARQIVPTAKLLDLMAQHAEHLQKLIEKDFIVWEKES